MPQDKFQLPDIPSYFTSPLNKWYEIPYASQSFPPEVEDDFHKRFIDSPEHMAALARLIQAAASPEFVSPHVDQAPVLLLNSLHPQILHYYRFRTNCIPDDEKEHRYAVYDARGRFHCYLR